MQKHSDSYINTLHQDFHYDKRCNNIISTYDIYVVTSFVAYVRMFVVTSDYQTFAVNSRSDMTWVHYHDISVGSMCQGAVSISTYLWSTLLHVQW